MASPNTFEIFWEPPKCTAEQARMGPDLIARYRAPVLRHAQHIQQHYPGEDVESRIIMGLYKAAYSWTPGPAGFVHWLRKKIRGEMSMIKLRFAYRQQHGITLRYLMDDEVDKPFEYRPNASHTSF